MTQRKLILVLGLLCIALIAVLPITAQTNPLDLDNDGLNNTVDACPRIPGPRTNRGCPLTTPTPNAPAADRDGDGVADFVDRCPDEAGTGFTEGCPSDQPGATPAPENGLVLVWDVYDRCLVGNNGRRNINIRAAVPSNADPSPEILGALPPGGQFEPSYAVLDDAGTRWYAGVGEAVFAPAGAPGWVSGAVAVTNGACGELPAPPAFTTEKPCIVVVPPGDGAPVFSDPALAAEPLTVLVPGSIFIPSESYTDAGGSIWFLSEAGWVNNAEVTTGGAC